MVGGQAVIEGVMMRVPGYYATAVRNPKGEIKIDKHKYDPIIKRITYLDVPIIRGAINLFEALKIGSKTLQWSAEINEPDSTENNKFIDLSLNIIAITFAMGLFVILPIISANFFFEQRESPFVFNLISGLTRIILFLIYLICISMLDDIKRLFQYHGAEHKTVYTFEAGLPLEIKNTHKFPTQHPRCGTSFLFIVMLVAILSFGIIDTILIYFIKNFTIYHRIVAHILFIPMVSGIGYEVLKISAKHSNNILLKILSKPGLWLQNITTSIPNDDQLEVALSSLKHALGNDLEKYLGIEFKAEAIG